MSSPTNCHSKVLTAALNLGTIEAEIAPMSPNLPALSSMRKCVSDSDSAYTTANSSDNGSVPSSPAGATTTTSAATTPTAPPATAELAPRAADAPEPARALAQIARLTAAFPETTALTTCVDTTTGCTKSCCVAANGFLEGATMAASARLGIAGVLDVLQTKFTWGSARCWTLCEAMKQREVDCGVGINVALRALALEPSVVAGANTLVKVQTVKRWKPFNAIQRRSTYADMAADAAEHAYLTDWIDEDCYYHQQVGIARPDGSLRIWDFGEWHQPPTDWTADQAILAIKLTPVDAAAAGAAYDWLGLAVPSGEWCSLLPAAVAIDGLRNVEPLPQSMTDAAKRAILQSVFADHSTVGDAM
jgi:hypothetical protein